MSGRAKITDIRDRQRREVGDAALAVLVRDMARNEEKLLQELIESVLNDPNACHESKRLAREIRC